MKVAYVTNLLSRAGGGVSVAVEALSHHVQNQEIELSVLGLEDAGWVADEQHWDGAPARVFPVLGPARLGLAPKLRRALLELNPDMVHVHGIWTHQSADVVAWSCGTKPYLVSPHGMLDPWAVANSSFKKRIARWLYEDRHLQNAACLHALCDAEAAAIRAFGLTNPICVIPNGVAMPQIAAKPAAPWQEIEPGARVLLFLGRLHPKKNIDGLLRALARLKAAQGLGNWRLVVAGWGQAGHAAELAALTEELSLCPEVTFLGPIHGAQKDAALRNASAFVLPSFSEGLPMAVLEAWSYALPVAMTQACNLTEGFAAGAALEIGTEPEEMAHQLSGFLSASQQERVAMGDRGAELARTCYSWERVSKGLADVYRWMLGGSDKRDRPTSVLDSV